MNTYLQNLERENAQLTQRIDELNTDLAIAAELVAKEAERGDALQAELQAALKTIDMLNARCNGAPAEHKKGDLP